MVLGTRLSMGDERRETRNQRTDPEDTKERCANARREVVNESHNTVSRATYIFVVRARAGSWLVDEFLLDLVPEPIPLSERRLDLPFG